MTTYKLDFSITTDDNRCDYISNICSQSTFSSKQYTQMADYILLASTSTSTSNFIYPEEFSSPHIIHNVESLDSLLEDPVTENFIENNAQPIHRTIYKTSKRRIDRENPAHSSIPGMKDLWQIIDNLNQKLQENPNNWKLKRTLIALYKQQYDLLEVFIPQSFSIIPIPHKDYYNWENGILLSNNTLAYLDLCNPAHMAKFLILYPSLYSYCDTPNCDLYQYLRDTEQAVDAANLTPLQLDILHLYHSAASGKDMVSYILKYHNRKLTQAYISIIFYKQIAVRVAEEYAEIYHSRIWKNDPTKWRICLCCKQKKLLTTHNFHHFSNKPGGFALYCKECVNKQKRSKQND